MDKSTLLSQIESAAQGFSGVLGICARRIGDSDTVEWNAAESFHPASTIKVPILVACLEAVRSGRLSLSERIRLTEADRVIGSGILRELCPGVELSLEDLLILMIAISDNTATNLVLDRVPPAEVTAFMRKLGHQGIFSGRKLFATNGPASEATPRDMVNLLEQLFTHAILTPELCDKALEIMYKQQFMDIIARNLPFDPFDKDEGEVERVRIASKSGSIRGVRHDVALVTTEKCTYAVALMSKDCADQRFNVDNEATLLLGRISRWVFDTYNS